jgi:hypothetical protein
MEAGLNKGSGLAGKCRSEMDRGVLVRERRRRETDPNQYTNRIRLLLGRFEKFNIDVNREKQMPPFFENQLAS